MDGAEWLKARVSEFVAALTLLTRLPVGRLNLAPPEDPGRAIWAYPLVGALVGALGGAVYWLCLRIGFPAAISAIYALAATILVTGALHEDGLADAADGLAGETRDERLAIMRDHQIGTYGVVALMLSLGLRVTALTLIAAPGTVVAALIAVNAVSRVSATALMLALPHARTDGLSVGAGRPDLATALAGLASAMLISLLLLPLGTALGVIMIALVVTAVVGCYAYARIGGQTGDLLGACCQLSECISLTLIAAVAA